MNESDQKRSLRNALGQFATGITVATTTHDGEPLGMTVNSFTSVSLEPPLVLWSVGRQSHLFEAFANCERYAINVLHSGQSELSNLFASSLSDRFGNTQWQMSELGLPLFKDCRTHFQCEVRERIDAGDHVILLAEVLEFSSSQHPPLVFFGGDYRTLS